MKYDTNITDEEAQELLRKIENNPKEYIEGVFYGKEGQEELDTFIEDTVNDYLEDLSKWNCYREERGEEKMLAQETMEIGVFLHFAFPKYDEGFYLDEILYSFDFDEEYYKGIYLDRIIGDLDNELREECSEITEEMYTAEKALYEALQVKNTKNTLYTAERALYDAIAKDYEVWWCEPIGKIEVKTVDFAYDENKCLVKEG